MNDSSAGGILAFIIAAPLVVICCGGHAALLASFLGGIIGTATSLDVLSALLIAVGAGVAALFARTFIRTRHIHDAEKAISKENQ